MRIEYIVPDSYASASLRSILKQELKLSSRLINSLKRNSGILVNGLPHRIIDPVMPGDSVIVFWEDECNPHVEPEDLPVEILYEDDWFLALNKPAGMPVHPSYNHQSGTLANVVQYLLMEKGLSAKIRPINRLDRDTSGITLFAKHSHAQDQIIRQMKENKVHKEYLGIVEGTFSPFKGTIDLPIKRKAECVMERVIDPLGERSITHYETVRTYGNYSLVSFVLETGRTHQIRVHCRACGHPIIGDWLYSDAKTSLISRQALHSHKLEFTHPVSDDRIRIFASIPDDMKSVLNLLMH